MSVLETPRMLLFAQGICLQHTILQPMWIPKATSYSTDGKSYPSSNMLLENIFGVVKVLTVVEIEIHAVWV